MSGGVDSSVVAAMLSEQGYDVVGITLQLYDHGAALARSGACCAGRDIHDARRIAHEFGFPHYVLDYESLFQETVIDEFADSYLAGATPVPCIRCNEKVKFEELLSTAKDLGGDCLATGHYVQRLESPAGPQLHSAADRRRDQSYFLFATTPAQLSYLRFPLGGIESKSETRALARRYSLPVADKPDSQDICFVPDGKYSDVIKKLRPGAASPGEIVDVEGKRLGFHDGLIHYTVGQRRGLGIGGLRKPLYVLKLDVENQRLIVGPIECLASRKIVLNDVNWLGDDEFADGRSWKLRVKVRSTRPPGQATVRCVGARDAVVELDTPEYGVAPGQACVFYGLDCTRVFGGGWIVGTAEALKSDVAATSL